MMMVSVSFSGSYDIVFLDGKYYSQPTLVQSQQCTYSNYWSNKPTGTIVLLSSAGVVPATLQFVTSQSYVTGAIPPYYGCDIQYKYAVVSSTSPCSSNQTLTNGQCVNNVPTCNADQILDTATNTCKPKCVTGSHYDATLKICSSDFEQDDKYTFENGNFIVYWADGAETYCDVSEEKCITHDKNFKVIPNRYLNPELAPDGTIAHGGLVPNSLPVSSWGSAVYDTLGKPLVNAAGFVLQALGTYIAIEATGSGSYLVNPTGLNSINPFAVLGAGLFTLGSAMVTPDEVVVATPTNTDNGVKVNVSTNSGVSFDSLSSVSSSTPQNGTPAFSPNGIYTYKQITDANLKTVWDTAGGVGKLPPTALVLGSDIIYPTNNPNTAIINSPTQIEIVKTSPDNTAQSVVINKADLANTASSGTDLPYAVKDYKAPVINNDGTVTQPITSTPSSISPTTGNNMSTDPITGETKTQNAANASGVANMSDGKSIDLSGIKGSIDQLGKQLEKGNGLLEKANGLLETGNGILNGIKSDTGSMKGSLNSIQGSLSGIKDLMSQSSDGLSESEWSNGIPTDYSVFETWKEAWNNLKGDFDSVTTKGNELNELVSGGKLVLNLPKGSVQQCPYNGSIDLVFAVVPLSFDFCTVLSPFRPVFYTMFYLFFVFTILFASLKTLMRMA